MTSHRSEVTVAVYLAIMLARFYTCRARVWKGQGEGTDLVKLATGSGARWGMCGDTFGVRQGEE